MIAEPLTLAKRALTKWARNPFAVVAVVIQATFWLVLFGSSFDPAGAFSASGGYNYFEEAFGRAPNYITFLTPGVIGIMALTSMSFMGADLVLDRLSGYLRVVSTYPIPRSSIYLGAVLQNVVKGMVPAPITLLLALAIPNGLKLGHGVGLVNVLGVFAAIALLTAVFSALFTAIAISMGSTDSFFGAVNFLTFPIMFTSTAFFPLSFFPGWLRPLAQANPISLASGAARLLLINGALSAAQGSGLALDLVGLLVFGVFFGVLGTLLARNALKSA
jgi:ABC-2 type transport system permease protein